MKRKFYFVPLLLSMLAFSSNSVLGNGITPVELQRKTDIGNYPYPKSPVLVPSISLDDHTLYLYSGCDGTTIEVLDENEQIVYTAFVAEGTETIELPSNLTGTYTLRVIRGSFAFVGEIEL